MPRHLITVVAAALLLAGCTVDDAPAPERFDGGPRRDPAWSVRMPDGFGRPVRAQVAGDAVVVEANSGVVVLARSDGAVRWQRKLTISFTASQVRVAGGTLVVDEGSRLRLVDLATGTERPQIRTSDVPADVAVTTTGVYVIDSADASGTRLVAYDLAGTARWQRTFTGLAGLVRPAAGDSADPLAAAAPGQVVLGVRQTSGTWVLWSLSPDTGADLARFPGEQDKFQERGERRTGDTVLTWDETGTGCGLPVTAIDPGTGTTRWQGPVGRWPLYRFAAEPTCDSAWEPLVVGGLLLASTPVEEAQVRDVGTGAVRWTGRPGTYPMTVAGDTLLMREGRGLGALVAVDLAAGTERWRRTLPADDGTPNVLNQRQAGLTDAFVLPVTDLTDGVTVTRRVVVLDARTGRPRWTTAGLGDLLGAGPAGVVTGFYSGLLPTDPGPVEIRYTPL